MRSRLRATGVGQVTGMIREVRTAAEVIGSMVSRAREILPGLVTNLSSENRG